MPRRTNAEMNATYLRYLALDKAMPTSIMAHILNIDYSVVYRWKKGSIPLPPAEPKPKSYYNDKARNKISSIEPETSYPVANSIPIKDEIYLLLVQGYSTQKIAMKLDKSIEVVVHTKAYLIRENIINPTQMNADLSFEEIGIILGISTEDTSHIYMSGIAKLFGLLKSSELSIEDLFETDAANRTYTGITSPHYSTMG